MEWDMAIGEFDVRFQSEAMCVDYLVRIKWPTGYHCNRCGCRNFYRTETRRLPLFECADCRYQASPIVGTIMEGSSTPIHKWLLAIDLISREDLKINAIELSRIIQVTYKTSWLMMHKIRHAMGEADAQVQLTGNVAVTSAIYGTKPFSHSFALLPQESPAFVGASMNSRQEPEYVKIKLVPKVYWQENDIHVSAVDAFTEENVEQDAMKNYVIKRYAPLKLRPTYSLFKASRKWIHTTFHGLGKRHLQAYLNEFCYRMNMKLRKSASIFTELAQLCISTQSITYSKLTG
jgi:hypothetical protein